MPIARGIAVALLVSLMVPAVAPASEKQSLSLAIAVQAARGRNPRVAASQFAIEAAFHSADQAGKWPNPVFAAYQETFPGAVPGTSQFIATISQRIRIGGQLGLAGKLATARARVAQTDGAASLARLTLAVQQLYVEAYSIQETLLAVGETRRRVQELLRALELRHAEGDVSRFDVVRMRMETESLAVQERQLAGDQRAGWERLAGVTGLEVPATGWILDDPALEPAGPPALATTSHEQASEASGSVDARPDLVSAKRRVEAAEIYEKLAGRQGIPDVTVTLGYTRLDPGFNGLVWSIGGALPLFDRNRDARAAATAETHRRERERAAMTREAIAERSAAWESYRSASEALKALAADTPDDLVVMARVAYEEGAMSVAGVLDAVRLQLDARLRRNALSERRTRQWFQWRWASGMSQEEISK